MQIIILPQNLDLKYLTDLILLFTVTAALVEPLRELVDYLKDDQPDDKLVVFISLIIVKNNENVTLIKYQ